MRYDYFDLAGRPWPGQHEPYAGVNVGSNTCDRDCGA